MIKGKTNTVIRFQIENCWPVHDMAQNMTRQMTSLGEFINISRIRVQDSLIHSLNKNLIVLTECYIVCPKIWSTFAFNRNTHTCKKKSAIEINDIEKIQNIFINTLSFFTHKNLRERKLISYGEL